MNHPKSLIACVDLEHGSVEILMRVLFDNASLFPMNPIISLSGYRSYRSLPDLLQTWFTSVCKFICNANISFIGLARVAWLKKNVDICAVTNLPELVSFRYLRYAVVNYIMILNRKHAHF